MAGMASYWQDHSSLSALVLGSAWQTTENLLIFKRFVYDEDLFWFDIGDGDKRQVEGFRFC